MKNLLFLFVATFLVVLVPGKAAAQTPCEEGELLRLSEQFFEAMKNSDTATLNRLIHPSCQLTGVGKTVFVGTKEGFVEHFSPGDERSKEERIGAVKVSCDGEAGTTEMYYRFFLDGELSHCGTNYFTWLKTPDGWQVIAVSDTRRREACPPTDREAIHDLLDNWHKAAAEADEDTYFGSMTYDGIFLGTDASERWGRDEFYTWAEEYFQREKAWAFTPYDRYIDFSADGQTAWFDEKLETWMDVCRGSGVLVKTNDGWKIKQYNLAVLVPNDKIQDYLKVLSGVKE